MNPRAEYDRLLAERRSVVERLRRIDERIGDARLGLVFATVVLGGLAWIGKFFDSTWLWLPVGLFVALSVWHSRAAARRKRAEAGMNYYERAVSRLENRWAGTGQSGADFQDPDHPYAADLDLFGSGSLFELLCTVQTRTGERTLAQWLLTPADPAEIRARHEAISELRPRIDLREELAILGGEVRAGVHADALAAWGRAPSMLPGDWARLTAAMFTVFLSATLFAWLFMGLSAAPFLIVFLAQMVFVRILRNPVHEVVASIDRVERELSVLSKVLARLEREKFTCARLDGLSRRLASQGGEPSSVRIARLARLVSLLDTYRNEMLAIPAFLFLWKTHFAFAIESWRRRDGAAVAEWLAAIGEMEALGALSCYSFEHPDDPFPEILESGAVFEGEGLGHPLIGPSTCVRNDLTLGRAPSVLMVSGSNMSGKSTLLRTVGTNTVLALAGAPVRASRLRLSPLSIGATLRIQDSLQAGTSRFYAEVKRLRQIVDLANGPRPLLFLLDEILHGTNSHDRRIGAESVLRGLIERGSIGLVTTHDLALAESAEALGDRARNVHFEDQLVDGKLTFDYKLKPGVVRKSNALELMRAVGLKV
jgi:hypothetical protein